MSCSDPLSNTLPSTASSVNSICPGLLGQIVGLPASKITGIRAFTFLFVHSAGPNSALPGSRISPPPLSTTKLYKPAICASVKASKSQGPRMITSYLLNPRRLSGSPTYPYASAMFLANAGIRITSRPKSSSILSSLAKACLSLPISKFATCEYKRTLSLVSSTKSIIMLRTLFARFTSCSNALARIEKL